MVKKKSPGGTNFIRIQGGKWRNRKLTFPSIEGLRPTKSMVKETLMNWARPKLTGQKCLDVLAGSGNLSFEFLSQGCHQVVCLEKSREACQSLEKNAKLLGTDYLQAVVWEYPGALPDEIKTTYDWVLLDPPFNNLWGSGLLDWVLEQNVVIKSSCVYLELPDRGVWPEHERFQTVKKKRSGGVQFGVLEVK